MQFISEYNKYNGIEIVHVNTGSLSNNVFEQWATTDTWSSEKFWMPPLLYDNLKICFFFKDVNICGSLIYVCMEKGYFNNLLRLILWIP